MSTAILALCVFAIGQPPTDNGATLRQAHDQAKAFAQAFHKDDYNKLAELSHPKLAEKIGSRARVAQAWKKKAAAYRYQGLKLEGYDVEAPKVLVKVGSDWLCVVPTQLKFQAIEGSASSNAYLLTLSHDQGKTWRILDGNDADTAKNLKDWLPKLADAANLPDISKASVDTPDAKRSVFRSNAANFKVCYPDRWDEGQRKGSVVLHLERGDNSVYFFAEETNMALDELVAFFDTNRNTGKPRKLFGHKDMTVAGEPGKFFRFEEANDQELTQVYVCVFSHQGMSYRAIAVRRGGDMAEFEEDYFSLLQRFAYLKDRPVWVKQFEGAPAQAVLLGGLASFEVQRPRWTEDTFDNVAEPQTLEYIGYRYLPGNAWMRVSLHEAQANLAAELQELLVYAASRLPNPKHKAVTFMTPAGKFQGWEVTGTFGGAPRTICITAVQNDGIAAWLMLESSTIQLAETRFEFEQSLESFQLQAQSKPAQPLAYPLRNVDSGRGDDPRVAAMLKKATRLYPGMKSHEIQAFTADGKQAILLAQDAFVVEDLVTKKRATLPVKSYRPNHVVLSPDRKWIAYQLNDEITVAPLGLGFTKKVRAHAGQLGFGPGNKELLIVTSSQKPRYDFRDDYRDGGGLMLQYVTSRLERLPLDGTPKKPLFDWPLIRVTAFALSPGGKQLAVVTNKDYPRTQQIGGYLYLCKPDGSDLRLLNKEPADYRSLAWSPDGKWIYALRRVIRNNVVVGFGGMYDVERIAADTGAAVNLTRCGRINHVWAGGSDLFLELNDRSLPLAQQGIFRVAADDLAKAAAVLPATKSDAAGTLAQRIAKRIEPALQGSPVREFVPTPAAMELLGKEFVAAVKDEMGVVLDSSPESLERLRTLIDQLELASGKHPVNILGVGAYYGETLRKLVGARWQLERIPFGQWVPARTVQQHTVAEVILPFSDTYGWALLSGRVVDAFDLHTRGVGCDWLLVYPPARVDDVMQANFADYLMGKKRIDDGDINGGLPLLAAEMKKRPKNAQLARELIALCKALERNDQAKAFTRQAVEAGVEANDLLMLHADDLMRGDAAKSIVYYRKAAHLSYAPAETLIKLGRAYEQIGQLGMAESCWRRAYLPASDLQRSEIRRMLGMADLRGAIGKDFKD